MSRCEKGQDLLQVGPKLAPLPHPCIPPHWCQVFLSSGSGFTNSITPAKPAQDRERERKPHPAIKHFVPEEKAPMAPQLSAEVRMGEGYGSEGGSRRDSDLTRVPSWGRGQGSKATST